MKDKDYSIQKGLVKQYVHQAEKYLKEKKFREALIYADQAIIMGEDLIVAARAYHVRSKIHNELKSFDLAIQDITKAIELNPHYSELYRTAAQCRAECCYENKNYDQAVEYYTKLIVLGRTTPQIYGSRALTYMILEKFEEAEGDRITAGLPEWFTKVNSSFYNIIAAIMKNESPHLVEYFPPDDIFPNGTLFFGRQFAGKGFDAKTGEFIYIS